MKHIRIINKAYKLTNKLKPNPTNLLYFNPNYKLLACTSSLSWFMDLDCSASVGVGLLVPSSSSLSLQAIGPDVAFGSWIIQALCHLHQLKVLSLYFLVHVFPGLGPFFFNAHFLSLLVCFFLSLDVPFLDFLSSKYLESLRIASLSFCTFPVRAITFSSSEDLMFHIFCLWRIEYLFKASVISYSG